MRLFASIVLAAAVAAGCGGKSKPPATTPPPAGEPPVSDAEFEAQMQAGMAYIEDLATSVSAAGTDCAAVAAAIEAVVGRHTETIATSVKYENDVVMKARSDAWAKAHQQELEAAAVKIGPPVGACQDDAAVQAAVEKMSPP